LNPGWSDGSHTHISFVAFIGKSNETCFIQTKERHASSIRRVHRDREGEVGAFTTQLLFVVAPAAAPPSAAETICLSPFHNSPVNKLFLLSFSYFL